VNVLTYFEMEPLLAKAADKYVLGVADAEVAR
jgi:hypothetical protein